MKRRGGRVHLYDGRMFSIRSSLAARRRPRRAIRPFARPAGAIAALLLAASLCACSGEETRWHGIDMKGAVPDLAFTMTRASDGKEVTARAFEDKTTLLYFGYTNCPDVCPLTLTNLTQVLKKLGGQASKARVLFVTVDPGRDTLDVMKQYAEAFAPQVVGLRGTDDQLAALAKRYRVAYSVRKDDKSGDIAVTHSSAIYAFDDKGHARLLFTNFSTPDADVEGMAADLRQLIEGPDGGSWLDRLSDFV